MCVEREREYEKHITPQYRTRVKCRYLSRRVCARGIFPGATVVRGRDWKWANQDGELITSYFLLMIRALPRRED